MPFLNLYLKIIKRLLKELHLSKCVVSVQQIVYCGSHLHSYVIHFLLCIYILTHALPSETCTWFFTASTKGEHFLQDGGRTCNLPTVVVVQVLVLLYDWFNLVVKQNHRNYNYNLRIQYEWIRHRTCENRRDNTNLIISLQNITLLHRHNTLLI